MSDGTVTPVNAKSKPPTPGKPGTGDQPIIEQASRNIEFEINLQIVLGTVFGVFGILAILVLIVFLYKFYRRDSSRSYGTSQRRSSLERSLSIEINEKQLPTVLILYSCDCSYHEKVVEALAGYLLEVCNCQVHIDLFEDQIIHEQGLDNWLISRLQEVDFIMVICSTGGRLRCTKKKIKLKHESTRNLPDYFAIAVDYVAEKMNAERTKGLPMSRFIACYFDYSTESDIPRQLESGSKFCLMKDIQLLFLLLHNLSSFSKDGECCPDVTDNTYDKSDVGIELKLALEQAKEYFKSNPNWFEERIYANLHSKPKSKHKRKSSLEPLLGLEQENVNTNNSDFKTVPQNDQTEVQSQTLPRSVKKPSFGTNLLHNRQNSLPSSINSHSSIVSPTTSGSVSKSFESFPPNKNCEFETNICVFCGQSGENHNGTLCTEYLQKHGEPVHHRTDIYEDMVHSSPRNKSKSLPNVCKDKTHNSLTVLQAEVHNEWDQMGRESSHSDSDSCVDPDQLEKDLQSIISPPTFDYVFQTPNSVGYLDCPYPKGLSLSEIIISNPGVTDVTVTGGEPGMRLNLMKRNSTSSSASSTDVPKMHVCLV